MYSAAVLPSLQGIARARHLLELLRDEGRDDLLEAKLAPDMFDCATQLEMVGDFALRATYPLTGQACPEMSGDDLDARLASAAQLVKALDPAAFAGAATRLITHEAGDARLQQTGHDYLTLFALPNLWFHLSMAFAILRANGMAVGKSDFDGWHAYAPGFSFET